MSEEKLTATEINQRYQSSRRPALTINRRHLRTNQLMHMVLHHLRPFLERSEDRTNEIIVPEDSVPELLERILKLQQPARLDRIKEELRGEHRPEQHFHAQIISLRKTA